MNRQEHKDTAERLLASSNDGENMFSQDDSDRDGDTNLHRTLSRDIARAHVHALLAQLPDEMTGDDLSG